MSDQTTDIDVMAVNLLQRERIAELEARELGFIQSLHELADTIAKREAENAKLRMNLDAYKQAEELWCRQDEKREVENAKLRRGVDNIKVRSYELGQRELHDMALAALIAKPEGFLERGNSDARFNDN